MKSMIPSLLIPDTALLPLITMAGLLMIFGFRKSAGGIVVFVVMNAFSPMFAPVIEALLDSLPDWAVIVVVIFIALQALRFVGELFLGPEGWGGVIAGIVLSILRSRVVMSISALLILRWWIMD